MVSNILTWLVALFDVGTFLIVQWIVAFAIQTLGSQEQKVQYLSKQKILKLLEDEVQLSRKSVQMHQILVQQQQKHLRLQNQWKHRMDWKWKQRYCCSMGQKHRKQESISLYCYIVQNLRAGVNHIFIKNILAQELSNIVISFIKYSLFNQQLYMFPIFFHWNIQLIIHFQASKCIKKFSILIINQVPLMQLAFKLFSLSILQLQTQQYLRETNNESLHDKKMDMDNKNTLIQQSHEEQIYISIYVDCKCIRMPCQSYHHQYISLINKNQKRNKHFLLVLQIQLIKIMVYHQSEISNQILINYVKINLNFFYYFKFRDQQIRLGIYLEYERQFIVNLEKQKSINSQKYQFQHLQYVDKQNQQVKAMDRYHKILYINYMINIFHIRLNLERKWQNIKNIVRYYLTK